jgi:hypothetical protein
MKNHIRVVMQLRTCVGLAYAEFRGDSNKERQINIGRGGLHEIQTSNFALAPAK